MKHYVAIDLGATSGRVIVSSLDSEGKLSSKTIHRFPTPLEEHGQKYFWNLELILENILKGLSLIAQEGIRPQSIGIDTWGVDFVRFDKQGKPESQPRAYRDPYSVKAMEEFLTLMPAQELYSRTGIQLMNFNSVFQLYAQAKAGELANTDKILFMPDALSYLLTGSMVCEYTILSTSALMDPRTKELDAKILQTCSLQADMFAPIVYPGHTIGTLTSEIQSKTGLGAVPVIAVAGHDTASVVAAVPARTRNFAYLSSGTWSLMGLEMQEPVINERMFELNYTNEGGVKGTTRLLKNITGMWILEQYLKKRREEGRYYSFQQVTQMAEAAPQPAHLINPDYPGFASPTDMPLAIRNYMTQNGWDAPEDDGSMFRLIYESLAARYAEVFSRLSEIAPFPIQTLHIVGGGSQNDFLNRLTARACKVEVVAGPAEGTALGNVMIQAGLTREQLLNSIETKNYKPI